MTSHVARNEKRATERAGLDGERPRVALVVPRFAASSGSRVPLVDEPSGQYGYPGNLVAEKDHRAALAVSAALSRANPNLLIDSEWPTSLRRCVSEHDLVVLLGSRSNRYVQRALKRYSFGFSFRYGKLWSITLPGGPSFSVDDPSSRPSGSYRTYKDYGVVAASRVEGGKRVVLLSGLGSRATMLSATYFADRWVELFSGASVGDFLVVLQFGAGADAAQVAYRSPLLE